MSQLVHFGGRPAKVDGRLVDLSRSRGQASLTAPRFQNGEAVLIINGAFAGIEATYKMEDTERRSMVLLEILSKPMQTDTATLGKAAD